VWTLTLAPPVIPDPPTITLAIPDWVTALSPAGSPVAFTLTSSAGTPSCTANGHPFASGTTLAPGEYSIVCAVVDPNTQVAATTTKVIQVLVPSGGTAGQQGPAGATGATGATGADGLPGPAGPQGPVGPQGPAGEPGAIGPQGEVGPQGPIGLPGVAGPQGAAGPQGEVGPRGEAGPQGPEGLPGAVGPQGPAGSNGHAGATGAVGAAGAMGPIGPVGPAGARGAVGPKAEGLFPGSLLMLPRGSQSPEGYSFVGTFTLSGDKKRDDLKVDVYQRR